VLSRVDLYARIRRDRRVDPGVSVRELARRHGVHRRTVREALVSAVPPERKKPARSRRLVLEPVMGRIDAMLREDLAAPRKQRHTMRRIYDRLVVEYGFDQACYSTVCNYVGRRRPEIEAEAREGRAHLDGTVPQEHEPGAEAEVDFADAWVRLAGEPVRCHMFTLRLSFSGKSVHRVYASQSQEAFMQGHVEAFAVLGGIPVRHVRYDNLKSAVSQVCFGRSRVESQRWTAFRSHSLLTELPALFSQFTGQAAGEMTTVSVRVRRRDAGSGSGGSGRPAGRRAGRDWQPLGAIPAA
jgi:transposase